MLAKKVWLALLLTVLTWFEASQISIVHAQSTAGTAATSAPITTAATTAVSPFVNGQMTITLDPAGWTNYSDNVVATFNITPPCAGISLYVNTSVGRQVCALGPACPLSNFFLGTTQAADPGGAWIRVSNLTTMNNDNYFALCPTNLRTYRTATPQGQDNLAIAVNPRILRVRAELGYFLSATFNFTRQPSQTKDQPDQFSYSNFSPISLLSYESAKLVFGVGKGFDPSTKKNTDSSSASYPLSIYSNVAPSNFSFTVPEFDDVTGNYSFVTRTTSLYSTTMSDVTPYGQYFQYTITKLGLARAKTCSIQTLAYATLKGAAVQDIASVRVDFTFPITIGSISVDRSSSCSCLFTCNTFACPTVAPSRVEWAFYDNTSSFDWSLSQIGYMAGNVPSRPDQLLLNSTDCQSKFRIARQQPTRYNIRCRVFNAYSSYFYSSNSSAASYSTALYDLLRPCNEAEFQCNTSLECLPSVKRCNGQKDCPDGSDEQNCNAASCRIGQYTCPTSKECIPSFKVCDSVMDCADKSDEVNCSSSRTNCAAGFWRCSNNRCVRGRYICDGDNDCGDNSDESNCGSYRNIASCGRNEFVCSNKKCASRFDVCDGTDDCGDNSDESNCGTYYSSSCGAGNWQCANGRCIVSYALCDGDNDCLDNSDEVGCGIVPSSMATTPGTTLTPGILTLPGRSGICASYEFGCNNGRCISRSSICNGQNDCGDMSDESNDTCRICPNGRFHCNNNKCIATTSLCDNNNDCGDFSDELPALCTTCSEDLDMWRCVNSKCIHISLVCNGIANCGIGDRSDESLNACQTAQTVASAKSKSCPSGTIACTSTNFCVPEASVCNGINDCCPSVVSYISGFPITISENDTHVGTCEKTDEIGCNRQASCSRNNGGCSARCVPIVVPAEPSICGGLTSAGEASYCTCNAGFRRPFDNVSACIDIDECRMTVLNNCSQICTNTIGSYNCSCVSGFFDKGILSSKGKATGYCVIPEAQNSQVDPYILFVYDDTIRLWQNPKASILVQTTLDKTFTALDVDIRDGTVIYAESGVAKLRRTSLPVTDQQPASLALHYSAQYFEIIDMSVDFIGNNLYVADTDTRSQSRITVSLIDGRYQKVLVAGVAQITSLATNPLLGRLYYATFSESPGFSIYGTQTIIMTSMNGNMYNNVEIYRSRTSTKIRTIAVDYLAGGRIYFFDGSRVAIANYDGTFNYTFTLAIYAPLPRAFDVFGNSLYGFFSTFSFSVTVALYELDKFGRVAATNLTMGMLNVAVARVYHPMKAGLRSSWPNPCKVLNCSHLCLLDYDKKASCACPDGRDQQNCVSKPFPEPEHPSACFKNCPRGQGNCVKDPVNEAFICMCSRYFTGKYCNDSLMPDYNNTTTSLTTLSTVAPVTAPQAVRSAGTDMGVQQTGSQGLLIGLIVLAVVVLVIIVGVAIVGFLYWKRRRDAANAQFSMRALSLSHDNVSTISS